MVGSERAARGEVLILAPAGAGTLCVVRNPAIRAGSLLWVIEHAQSYGSGGSGRRKKRIELSAVVASHLRLHWVARLYGLGALTGRGVHAMLAAPMSRRFADVARSCQTH